MYLHTVKASILIVLLSLTVFAQVPDPIQAGRTLFDRGVDGLTEILRNAGAPPLTFDQESQIRTLHEVYQRQGTRLLEEQEDDEAVIRTLAEQLFLAMAKFLNPVQRDALGVVVDANSDLPRDENELREYLRDLTSTAANQEQDVVIDGFEGGRMPNRDEIMEIRINDNAFTAEQSEQGRGRTEIRTRGGTGQFNGDATFEFADESLDARNAFASFRPPYQTREFEMNLSGPLKRDRVTATFSLSKELAEDGDTLRALTPNGLVADAITRPERERNLTARSTVQLNQNHALTFSYTHATERRDNNGVGGFDLPEQGSQEKGSNQNFQIQETAVLTPRINHEVRFRINAESEEAIPFNTGPHIVVPDAFEGGGSTDSASGNERDIEFGNLLMYTGGNISLKAGFDGAFRNEESETRNNFNGTFTFGSLDDYIARRPLQYNVNQGDPLIAVSQFEAAAFLQSDFRVTPRFTMGFGVRYEAQQNLSDRNDIDPRFGFAYQVGSNTVLRGGSGIFHERIPIWQLQDLLRFDGQRQRTLIIRNPSYPDPFQTGTQSVRLPSSVRVRAEDMAAPYTWISEMSVETTLPSGLALTGSYRFIRGVHLLRGRNLNAPLDITASRPSSCRVDQTDLTCLRPQPDRGNIIQWESTGLSSTQEFRIGFQQRLSFINVRGNYTARIGNSDVAGDDDVFEVPADNYDMSTEWGPTNPRQSVNASVNLRLPWTIDADTIFNWNSGEPYTVLTGRDDNRDTSTTDRPAGVHRNSLWGPSFFEMDMNLSKTFPLFTEAAASSESGPVAGGGYFGRRSGMRMTVSAEARNVLNKVNYDRVSGVLTSPFFGKPIRAREGRSISMSVRFDF